MVLLYDTQTREWIPWIEIKDMFMMKKVPNNIILDRIQHFILESLMIKIGFYIPQG